jgi:hypothetical protein
MRYGTWPPRGRCNFWKLPRPQEFGPQEFEGNRTRTAAPSAPPSHLGSVLNEHFEEDGAIVFREACRLGCEGIVSKRLGSTYRRGRSPHWVKVKNPNAPAVKREAEQDWGRGQLNVVCCYWFAQARSFATVYLSLR